MTGLVNNAVFGHIHNLHELSASEFGGPPRADVFRIAGDPKNLEVKLSRDPYQQAYASCCVPMTPDGRDELCSRCDRRTDADVDLSQRGD
jgi:hypothetical protein